MLKTTVFVCCQYGSDFMTLLTASSFYRAMLCMLGTSHEPVSVSVSVSVTSRYSVETAERIKLVFGM